MAVLQQTDIVDLTVTGLQNLDKPNLVQLATNYQKYPVMNQLMRQERVIKGGWGLKWDINMQTDDAAQNVGLYQVDNVNVGDGVVQAAVDWRHTNVPWAFDIREPVMNGGAERIVDILKVRRDRAVIDYAEKMEKNFWESPAASTNTTDPWGVPYWLVWTSPGTAGFLGGNNSAYTGGPAGVNRTTYSQWKNYQDTYVNVTKADLIRKIRKAMTFTHFMPPTGLTSPSPIRRAPDYAMYTLYTVVQQAEELAESQNDRLGPDIASMDGRVSIRGVPLTWTPYLEGRTGTPIYGINWAASHFVVLPGFFMRMSVNPAPNQHLSTHNHVDTTYNFRMQDCRQNFVIATTDPGNS